MLMGAVIVAWAVPVAFTGFLSQLGSLSTLLPSLVHFAPWLLGFLQGVLPQSILVILTILLPVMVRLLVEQRGFILQTTVETTIQNYYFCFLFIQVFLTVALSSSATTILGQIYHNFNTVAFRGEAQIRHINQIPLLPHTHQEILRLDVSMDDALGMDIFETVEELVDEHQRSLEREFATAEVEKVFQTRP